MVELIRGFVESAMLYLDTNVSVTLEWLWHGKEQMYSIKENGTKAKLL
jgi:hypothetical protein